MRQTALVAFSLAAREHIGARQARYDSPTALERYAHARGHLALASIALGVMAILPLIAAVT